MKYNGNGVDISKWTVHTWREKISKKDFQIRPRGKNNSFQILQSTAVPPGGELWQI